MASSQQIALAQKYHDAARQIRGRYLNSVAVLETEMAKFITGYFCVDDHRADLFFSEIATGQSMMLNQKIKLLSKIVKKDYSGFLAGHPTLFKTLDSVREYRNHLAHATLDVSPEQLSKTDVDGIGFVYYKDGVRLVNFVALSEADEKQAELNTLISDFRGLMALQSVIYPRVRTDVAI